jgi:lipopolysaccharide biosynthesis protein
MTKKRALEWASTLKRGLLDPEQVRKALGILQEDERFALYYPTAERVLSTRGYSWTSNGVFAKQMLARLGVPWIDGRFPYPAGAMFIANPWLTGMLRKLDLSPDDFPKEPFPVDGSIAHALERIIGYVPHYLGLKHLTLSMEGDLSSDVSYIDFDAAL